MYQAKALKTQSSLKIPSQTHLGIFQLNRGNEMSQVI